MTEARTINRELQDEVLNTIRKSQTAVIEAIQTWTSKVQSMTPELPELSIPFADNSREGTRDDIGGELVGCAPVHNDDHSLDAWSSWRADSVPASVCWGRRSGRWLPPAHRPYSAPATQRRHGLWVCRCVYPSALP